MNKVIAIDGPSGSGKSTIAKKLALKLGIDYLDTGAMYRAITLKYIKFNISKNDELSKEFLENTRIDFENGEIVLDGVNVEDEIRKPEVARLVPNIAKQKLVREFLVEMQRSIAKQKPIVADGRDMGTTVFPKASVKIFLTASADVRAKRRYQQHILQGKTVKYEEILKDVMERDEADINREISPLKKADDAILVDTSEMTIEKVIKQIEEIIKKVDYNGV